MKEKLLLLFFGILSITTGAQTISLVGDAASGWNTDLDMTTTDGVTYTLANHAFTTGGIKFRRDHAWTTSWGGTNFPNGTALLNSSDNIPVSTGVYTVTFNSFNGTYTFIGTSYPSIGIWGPAVNSQLGYTAPDVDMTTVDGINYTLSGFNFSSGNAYFRQDNATTLVWGSTSYPAGTALLSGPSLFIPGGEHYVTFNRITGEYQFSFPSVGIIGSALNGFTVADTDLATTDGFTYTISDLALTVGEVKFRKDNSWLVNWGASGFPNGVGVQDGVNIPIAQAAHYDISFDRSTGAYYFYQLLNSSTFHKNTFKISPNPTHEQWTIFSDHEAIQSIEIRDALGKIVYVNYSNKSNYAIDASLLQSGVYFAKISTIDTFEIVKLVKD